jgi:hypothetical protein
MHDTPFRPSCKLLILPVALALTGCSDTAGGYPSLQPRPVEQLSFAEPQRAAPPPAVADPAAIARFAPMIERARKADDVFRQALKAESGALARGRKAATGSDAWGIAQQSLSRVETARGPVQRILSDLDAARNAPPTETSTGEALAAAQAFDEVQAIDRSETDALRAVAADG